jgi:hypothetical protein
VLEKNHRHYSNPNEDLVMDLDEDEHTAAYNFYAKDQFESLEVANNAVLKGAWGKIGDDELKSVNLAGLETTDQEKLEAKEAKERQKKAVKRTRLDLQKIRRQAESQAKKASTAKTTSSDAGPSGSNSSTQPSTPPPPPPNQLQHLEDNDRTPKGECVLLLTACCD